MNERLIRRYERLLEAYPESYRAGRGAEMPGTLLVGVSLLAQRMVVRL